MELTQLCCNRSAGLKKIPRVTNHVFSITDNCLICDILSDSSQNFAFITVGNF